MLILKITYTLAVTVFTGLPHPKFHFICYLMHYNFKIIQNAFIDTEVPLTERF